MFGFGRLIAVIALVGVLALIGISVYNAGVSAGLAETGTAVASGAPVVYYGPYVGHPWGWGGFGFFGIFFWILGIFLIFGLIRAVFGFGRWGGRRDWYGHHGPGGYGPPKDHLDDWHRRAHQPGDEPKNSEPTSS
jgi:hypothetical protein